MNCARVRQEIKAYIDGELRPWTRILVSRHIATCDDCRREMQEMAELTNDVRTAPDVSAPRGLREKVLGSLTFQPGSPRSRRWPFASAWANAAAGLVIVVVLGSIIMPTLRPAREAARTAAVRYRASVPQGASPMPVTKAKAVEPSAKYDRVGLADRDSVLQSAPISAPSTVQMIIKTAELGVKVSSFDRASDEAVSIARSVGGYVTDTSSASEQGTPTEGCMTLRIPAEAFERTLSRLAKLGSVTSRSIAGEDVTGESIDLESRLRNLRAEERQYLDIMTRARRIPDVVTVTNELSRVRGEIEESQGRLKYLRSSAAMSTIDLTLKQPKPGTGKVHGASIINAFTGAGSSLKETVKSLLTVIIWLLVYSPFWALPIGFWLYYRKRAAAGAS